MEIIDTKILGRYNQLVDRHEISILLTKNIIQLLLLRVECILSSLLGYSSPLMYVKTFLYITQAPGQDKLHALFPENVFSIVEVNCRCIDIYIHPCLGSILNVYRNNI
jgi:hypothetical protein